MLDDLIREVLAADTTEARGAATARLLQVPDALNEIAQKLGSTDWAQRSLALHFVTRCLPPPPIFTSGVIHCLRSPLDLDPLGDETALVLVCCGMIAHEVSGFRELLATRVRAIDIAEGPRGPVMRKLAHETLDRVDAVIAESNRRWRAGIDAYVELVRAGQRDEATARIDADSADSFYPELGRAARWEDAGDVLAASEPALARFCYSQAHDNFAWHASGASSGGEGMARMLDVHRVAKKRGGT